MWQLWPQTDLDSNLGSTNALSPGPGDFTPSLHFQACRTGMSMAPSGGAKGMEDGHTCKAPDMGAGFLSRAVTGDESPLRCRPCGNHPSARKKPDPDEQPDDP